VFTLLRTNRSITVVATLFVSVFCYSVLYLIFITCNVKHIYDSPTRCRVRKQR